MTGTPFFSSRKALFLNSLALCSLVSLSLSAFNVSSIARYRNVYDAEFFSFSFHEKLHQAYGDVCHDWFQYGKIPSYHYFILSDSFRGMLVPLAFCRGIKHLINFPRMTRAKVSRLFLQSLCALHMQKPSPQDHLFSSCDLV